MKAYTDMNILTCLTLKAHTDMNILTRLTLRCGSFKTHDVILLFEPGLKQETNS